MQQHGWRSPRRWARVGAALLVPTAALDWFALVSQTVVVAAFAVGVVGLIGIGAAAVTATLRRGKGTLAACGLGLFLAGLALFGLNPFPGSSESMAGWWPETITQPQLVGSAYWTIVGLWAFLTGLGMLGVLLVLAVTRTSRPVSRR